MTLTGLLAMGIFFLIGIYNMNTWQVESNAIHFTKESLKCVSCKKFHERVIDVQANGYYCLNCFIITNRDIFEGQGYLIIRSLVDTLFSKRKIHRKQERQSMTLKLRYKILCRDNFKCVACGKNASEVKLHIDHKIPVSMGGKTAPDNL